MSLPAQLLPVQEAQVWCLVRELRPCTSCSSAPPTHLSPTPTPAPCQKRNPKMSYLPMGEIQASPRATPAKLHWMVFCWIAWKRSQETSLSRRPRGLPPFLNRRESGLNTRPFLSTERFCPPGMLWGPKDLRHPLEDKGNCPAAHHLQNE